MEPKTGRKIVSRGEYLRRRLFRISGKGTGIVVQIGAVIFGVITPFLFMGYFDVFQHDTNSNRFFVAVILMAIIVGVGWMMFRDVGIKIVQRSDNIDVGVPLTRANTADLPAPESLVRASSEPEQVQQAVLLRAAGEEQESRAEELARASARQE